MRTTVAPAKAPGTLTSDTALARRCPDGGCTSIAAGGTARRADARSGAWQNGHCTRQIG